MFVLDLYLERILRAIRRSTFQADRCRREARREKFMRTVSSVEKKKLWTVLNKLGRLSPKSTSINHCTD